MKKLWNKLVNYIIAYSEFKAKQLKNSQGWYY